MAFSVSAVCLAHVATQTEVLVSTASCHVYTRCSNLYIVLQLSYRYLSMYYWQQLVYVLASQARHSMHCFQYHALGRKCLRQNFMCMLSVEISPAVQMLLHVGTKCVLEATSHHINCKTFHQVAYPKTCKTFHQVSLGCIPQNLQNLSSGFIRLHTPRSQQDVTKVHISRVISRGSGGMPPPGKCVKLDARRSLLSYDHRQTRF